MKNAIGKLNFLEKDASCQIPRIFNLSDTTELPTKILFLNSIRHFDTN